MSTFDLVCYCIAGACILASLLEPFISRAFVLGDEGVDEESVYHPNHTQK